MISQCKNCGSELPSGANSCLDCGSQTGAPAIPKLVTPPEVNIPPTRKTKGVWVAIAAIVTGFVGLVIFAFFGIYWLWMLGPGGEIAFKRYNKAGNDAYSRGDFRAANAEYSKMIELRPRRGDGYTLLGLSETKAGMYLQAIRMTLPVSPIPKTRWKERVFITIAVSLTMAQANLAKQLKIVPSPSNNMLK